MFDITKTRHVGKYSTGKNADELRIAKKKNTVL